MTGAPAAKLSSIVVSYNTRALTLECLCSVFTTLDGNFFRLVVVDNASGDGSAEAIEQEFKQVTLLRNNTNRGFAAANNQALRLCRTPLVLLLNSDTVLSPGAIEAMAAFLERTPDAGAAGCELRDKEGEAQFSCRRYPTIRLALHRYFAIDRQAYAYDKSDPPFPVESLSGACLMFKREVYEKIGGMDERYFMFAEDIDYCYRINKAGLRCYFLPGAWITHLGSQSLGNEYYTSISAFARHPLHRANYLFYRTYHNWAMAALYWLIYRSGLLYLRLYGPLVSWRDRFQSSSGIHVSRRGIKKT